MKKETLIQQAILAMDRAYVPYSKFRVGASILLKDGTYILGANIENASYGLSNCAERSAIFSLFSQGYKKEEIVAIAIVAHDKNPVSPCGACRQVLFEHVDKHIPIFLCNTKGDVKEVTIEALLPYGFSLEHE